MIVSILECHNLLRLIKWSEIKTLHYFEIFENDANLFTLLLRRESVHVNKIPSDIPLVFANRVIIADTLSCCQLLQQDEAKAFAGTIRTKNIRQWLPEDFISIASHYNLPEDFTTPKNTLGYYSSGGWVRQKEGYPDFGIGIAETERNLVKMLRNFLLASDHKIKLIVFTHPEERKTKEHFEEALTWYANAFEGANYEVRDINAKTPFEFQSVDVSISACSQVSFERLFMGFKSIIYPYGIDEIPEGTIMRGISATSENELLEMLEKSLSITREEFIHLHNLKGGTVDSFLPFYQKAKKLN